jgi:curved DNA-binding protein CbpA
VKPSRDLYEALGTARRASQEDIRKAHRKLAREHHPDANPGDPGAEERFKEVQRAYELLSDPKKRRQCDERLGASSGGAPRAHPREARRRGGCGPLRPLAQAGRLLERASGRARGEQLAHLARSLGPNITLLSRGLGENPKTGSAADPEGGGPRGGPSGADGSSRQKRVRFEGRRAQEKKVKCPKARRRRRGS